MMVSTSIKVTYVFVWDSIQKGTWQPLPDT